MDERPLTIRDNGQIHIILHGKRDVQETALVPTKAPVKTVEHVELIEIEEEMNQLIGLDEIKKIIKEIYAWIYINKKREAIGLKNEKQVLHMMFKGNPGTGKTTMARLIGKLFVKMNVLTKGHLIEAERADLVGEYIGHTAQKTRELVKRASGGILFIDEAYSLGRGGEKDFGREAIDTLVKHMEDRQHEFILILAGYSKEMNHFLKLNPGLRSRFPIVVDFPNYSTGELMQIAEKMLLEKQYFFSADAEKKLYDHLEQNILARNHSFANGRYIRNIIEKSLRKQSMRLLMQVNHDRQDLMMIRSIDICLTTETPNL